MDIGIGLPTAMRGTTLEQTLDCARRAEADGFASVATIDRLVYANHDPLIALSVVAAVTQRVRLVTGGTYRSVSQHRGAGKAGREP